MPAFCGQGVTMTMQIITLDQNRISALEKAIAVLRGGGVAVIPTETVYGLMTRYDNAAGRDRIFALKHRSADKQLQMLAADLPSALAAGVVADPRLEKLACQLWPGPLTVICRGIAETTVGLRIPDHLFIRDLIRQAGFPLAATSANLSGQPPAKTAAAAVADLDGEPDLVIDGGPADGVASTVVSLLESPPKILRPGAISLEQILAALQPPGLPAV